MRGWKPTLGRSGGPSIELRTSHGPAGSATVRIRALPQLGGLA